MSLWSEEDVSSDPGVPEVEDLPSPGSDVPEVEEEELASDPDVPELDESSSDAESPASLADALPSPCRLVSPSHAGVPSPEVSGQSARTAIRSSWVGEGSAR